MRRKEAHQQVVMETQKAGARGVLLWIAIPVFGVLGWIFWKWYAILIAIVAGVLYSCIYSYRVSRKVERMTGLNIDEQERLYKGDFDR